jgi:hypothetical protein
MIVRRGVAISEGWGGINAASMLGVRPASTIGQPDVSMGALAPGTSSPLEVGGTRKPWHPDNPMFWVGVLLAATFGLVGASTSIRVGPFKASAGAGKT